MSNKKSIVISYNGLYKTYPLSTKSLSNQTLLDNKVEMLKHGFATAYVTKQWLSIGLVSFKDNCLKNENGYSIPVLATKSLPPALLSKFDAEVKNICKNIVVTINK